jgi:hypothetical protein
MKATQSQSCRNTTLLTFGRAVATMAAICVALTSCESGSQHSNSASASPAAASPAPKPSMSHDTAAATPAATTATPAPPGTTSPPLTADFATLQNQLHGKVGIVVSAVGANPQQVALGDLTSGPAWSTMKVPVIMTAFHEGNPPAVTDPMRAAITASNNAAAESVWGDLGGDSPAAAQKVEAFLRKYGDPTTVQWRKVRQQFTAFGQTDWSLANQVRFIAAADCDSSNAGILTLMDQVEADQRWGLGGIPSARFKGGWGPSEDDGHYLVRQFGVLTTSGGLTAVAIATEPTSGSFSDGTQALTDISKWLDAHKAQLPVGQCGR